MNPNFYSAVQLEDTEFQNIFCSKIVSFKIDLAVKLNKILSERYFAHLMQLPQKYFDTELSGKIISRLNRSIVQIVNFIQMMKLTKFSKCSDLT